MNSRNRPLVAPFARWFSSCFVPFATPFDAARATVHAAFLPLPFTRANAAVESARFRVQSG